MADALEQVSKATNRANIKRTTMSGSSNFSERVCKSLYLTHKPETNSQVWKTAVASSRVFGAVHRHWSRVHSETAGCMIAAYNEVLSQLAEGRNVRNGCSFDPPKPYVALMEIHDWSIPRAFLSTVGATVDLRAEHRASFIVISAPRLLWF